MTFVLLPAGDYEKSAEVCRRYLNRPNIEGITIMRLAALFFALVALAAGVWYVW